MRTEKWSTRPQKAPIWMSRHGASVSRSLPRNANYSSDSQLVHSFVATHSTSYSPGNILPSVLSSTATATRSPTSMIVLLSNRSERKIRATGRRIERRAFFSIRDTVGLVHVCRPPPPRSGLPRPVPRISATALPSLHSNELCGHCRHAHGRA